MRRPLDSAVGRLPLKLERRPQLAHRSLQSFNCVSRSALCKRQASHCIRVHNCTQHSHLKSSTRRRACSRDSLLNLTLWG